MDTHRDIIHRFGGPAALRRLLNEPCYQKIYHWQSRGIPARHWQRLIDLAGREGIAGVTFERLAARYGETPPEAA